MQDRPDAWHAGVDAVQVDARAEGHGREQQRDGGQRDDRDVAIVTLLLVAVTFETIWLLNLAESAGGLIELLFLCG